MPGARPAQSEVGAPCLLMVGVLCLSTAEVLCLPHRLDSPEEEDNSDHLPGCCNQYAPPACTWPTAGVRYHGAGSESVCTKALSGWSLCHTSRGTPIPPLLSFQSISTNKPGLLTVTCRFSGFLPTSTLPLTGQVQEHPAGLRLQLRLTSSLHTAGLLNLLLSSCPASVLQEAQSASTEPRGLELLSVAPRLPPSAFLGICQGLPCLPYRQATLLCLWSCPSG